MKKLSILFLAIFVSCGFENGEKNPHNPAITSSELMAHINYLASDELAGRMTGSEEIKLAAEYIKQDFVQSGLTPLIDEDFLQSFNFIAGLELTDKNSLKIFNKNNDQQLILEEEFIPAPFSGKNEIKSDAVFAGYGISAPDLNYDDYNNIDVKNKIVIVLRYSPEGENPHSDFEKYSSYRFKAKTAQEKGAAGIIFVNGFIPKNDEDNLMKLEYDRASGMNDFPAVQIKRDILNTIFSERGKDLKGIQSKINEQNSPNSFLIDDLTILLSTEVKEIEQKAYNVIGQIGSSDPNYNGEYLIIGAHYDHLGYGTSGSLYRGDKPMIHNGADDNASGTAGLLELAEKFSSIQKELKRSIIFIAFSGEELGLLGSNYFVKNPPFNLNRVAAMINLDMIGRIKDSSLIIYGTGTSSGWKDLLNRKNEYDLKLSFNDEGYGPSDHSSFYGKEIPVLFFFTGTHSDYHRPSDDADHINSSGIESVVNYAFDVGKEIAAEKEKPDYINVPRKDGGRMSFRVYVGTIPDYAEQVDGLKITGVSEGSPAQKGGLQGGDVIKSFGGKKISNIYDYTYALGDFTPGDIVEVVVDRNGERINLQVELGAR